MNEENLCFDVEIRILSDAVAIMRHPSLLALTLVLVACCSCSGNRHHVLTHDAYIWRRRWTPALVDAMRRSSDLVAAWRVLVAEFDARGNPHPALPDWNALGATARPVVAVIRIDGRLVDWDEPAMAAAVDATLKRAIPRGAKLAGLEIDHDCATAHLGAYAAFIAQLRPRLPDDLKLSITVLPAWMSSPELDTLLVQADEAVLQVHSVQNPHAGLIDPHIALKWTKAFARRSPRPFLVALPAYGSRISWRADGTILAVQSEAPLLAGGYRHDELIARPIQIAELLRSLQDDPPRGLFGIAWFRLPSDDDTRAWSVATWRAVVSGADLRATVEIAVKSSGVAGMNNLVLLNTSAVDAEIPSVVGLPSGCQLADAINGYAIERGPKTVLFRRREQGLLRSHYQQAIGWMRCAAPKGSIHVEP